MKNTRGSDHCILELLLLCCMLVCGLANAQAKSDRSFTAAEKKVMAAGYLDMEQKCAANFEKQMVEESGENDKMRSVFGRLMDSRKICGCMTNYMRERITRTFLENAQENEMKKMSKTALGSCVKGQLVSTFPSVCPDLLVAGINDEAVQRWREAKPGQIGRVCNCLGKSIAQQDVEEFGNVLSSGGEKSVSASGLSAKITRGCIDQDNNALLNSSSGQVDQDLSSQGKSVPSSK